MNERVLKSLYDIKIAIDEINTFFIPFKKSFETYKSNTLLRRAIERNLEIIGKAIGRILKEDYDFKIENARRIVGLRNQITHGYDTISDENIWAIVEVHLPILKEEVEKLIKE